MQIGFIALSKNCRLHIIREGQREREREKEKERCNIATLDLPSSWIKLFSLILKDCNIEALSLGAFFLGWSPVDPDSFSFTCSCFVTTASSKLNSICQVWKQVQSWQLKGLRKIRNRAHWVHTVLLSVQW